MGYQKNLWRMLQPLGVYSESGYSGGALTALGTAMDKAERKLCEQLRESLVLSAEDAGLTRAEEIFPMLAATETTVRREALKKLWQTDNLSCSVEGIIRTLEGCGVKASILSTGSFAVMVILPEAVTIWDEPVFLMWVLEQIMPCHLMVNVRLSYEDVETGQSMVERLPLKQLRQRTQKEWEQRLGAYM